MRRLQLGYCRPTSHPEYRFRQELRGTMCFFSAIYRVLPECPVLILANRDEYRVRPAAGPRLVSSSETNTAWLGGIDLEKGGTWLGINQFGIIVAITNRGRRGKLPANVRSRGLLCRDLLACRSVEAALQEARRQKQRHPFDGFNLLILGAEDALIMEAPSEVHTVRLSPGVHAITNGPRDNPSDPRIARGRMAIESMLRRQGGSLEDRLTSAQRICALAEGSESTAICLTGVEWGTVSSTIVALTHDASRARYLYAPGPPNATPYNDYSSQLQELLARATPSVR